MYCRTSALFVAFSKQSNGTPQFLQGHISYSLSTSRAFPISTPSFSLPPHLLTSLPCGFYTHVPLKCLLSGFALPFITISSLYSLLSIKPFPIISAPLIFLFWLSANSISSLFQMCYSCLPKYILNILVGRNVVFFCVPPQEHTHLINAWRAPHGLDSVSYSDFHNRKTSKIILGQFCFLTMKLLKNIRVLFRNLAHVPSQWKYQELNFHM